jgi:hypothetical protein
VSYQPGAGGVSVRVVRPTGSPRATARSRSGLRSARPARAKRVTAWIVRSIMVATAAFALLDLFLLTSSAHH